MPVTLSTLLARPALGLTVLNGTRAQLAVPLTWAASTDLPDPTPFLGEGNLVLTTGRQFVDEAGASAAADYVARLGASGIRGIGFGTDVISAVPLDLVGACERGDMPLIEVPYRTPFLAIIRAVADLVAAEAQERSAWAANAQRTISLAAMREDGLRACIAELSRQLERGVALFDARGRILHSAGGSVPEAVDDEAARLLERGGRAASTIDGALVQTVGKGGALRGVLAVSGPLDHAAQTVVSAVVALAGMALERRRSLAASSRLLRAGAWQSLMAGNLPLAVTLSAGAIPDSFVVGMLDADAGLLADLEANADLFVAQHDDRTVVIAPETEWARAIAAKQGVPVGVSSRVGQGDAARAAREAALALARAEHARGVVAFDALVDDGFAAALDADAARVVAALLLRPIAEHDDRHGTALVSSLRAWLEHNGQWDPAATELGIHRHTLRNRIRQIERLTERDLGSARTRADYVLALNLRDATP